GAVLCWRVGVLAAAFLHQFQGPEPDAQRSERHGAVLVEPPGQGEGIDRTVNETASRFARLLDTCGWPGTRSIVGSARVGDTRCNGHGHTPGVPGRAPPGEIRYTSLQTTWAVYVPGTLRQPRVRSIPPRTCACGALLFVRLSHLSSSVPAAFALH